MKLFRHTRQRHTLHVLACGAAAYGCMAVTHVALTVGGFPALYWLIRRWPRRCRRSVPDFNDCTNLVSIADRAAMYYLSRARCLHYSAALVCLTRLYGAPTELVIGVRQRPFIAHAWVEYGGAVLAGVHQANRLQVVERC